MGIPVSVKVLISTQGCLLTFEKLIRACTQDISEKKGIPAANVSGLIFFDTTQFVI